MSDINSNTMPIICIAYLKSHQEELQEFLKLHPDISDDYSNYVLQYSDSDDDSCNDIEEYVEYFYWQEFVKFHDNYIPLS